VLGGERGPQIEAAAVRVPRELSERRLRRRERLRARPQRFSFEASLIEPVMPSSRSSSEIGLPGM